MDIKQQLDQMQRALVPVLEREIAELRPKVEATRGSFLYEGFARELGMRERALASIHRDCPPR